MKDSLDENESTHNNQYKPEDQSLAYVYNNEYIFYYLSIET